jgi:molybdenum cofactor cytidylyltransferase
MSQDPESHRTPAIVVLEAGGSVRMRTPEHLLPAGSVSRVRRAAERALASGGQPVVVVLGEGGELVRSELEELPLHLVTNPDWQAGLAGSIACGVQALLAYTPSVDSVLLMLADQAKISEKSLQKLITAYRHSGSNLVAAWYSEQFGTPALFSRAYFDKLLKLRGRGGPKAILERHMEDVVFVDLPEAAVDLDTSGDAAFNI